MFGEICYGIFIEQITDMADSHGIKNSEVHRIITKIEFLPLVINKDTSNFKLL